MKADLRCKVCQLAKSKPELFEQLHEDRSKGFTINQLFKWLTLEISKHNGSLTSDLAGKKLPQISDTALQNHFQKHAPVSVTVASKVNTKLQLVKPAQEPVPTNMAAVVTPLLPPADAQGELGDFQKFHDLVERVQLRMEQIDTQLNNLIGKEKEAKEVVGDDVAALVSYLNAFRALADLLGRLRKDAIIVRQQDTMLRKVVESVMSTYSTTAIIEMLKSFDNMIIDYKGEFKTPSKGDAFSAKFRTELARVMTDSAKMALESVKNEFKVA